MKKVVFLLFCAGFFGLAYFVPPVITQSFPPLRVREADGSPNMPAIREIRVPNGSLTQTAAGIASLSFGSGTVTSVSVVTANGVSGSVATATTTPAITLTLGAITPTTVSPTAALTQFISSFSSANASLGATAQQITIKNTDTTANNYAQIGFLNDEGNAGVGLITQYTDHSAGAQTSTFNVMTRVGGSYALRATVDSTGINLPTGETYKVDGTNILSAYLPLAGGDLIGNVTTTGTIVQTSASATAFESGPNGSTNPVLRLVNSTASQADGVSINGGAAGAGTTFTLLSSGSNSGFIVSPLGTGTNSAGLSVRNGATAQRVKVYQSYADSGNGAWIEIDANGNGNAYIGTNKNGSGSSLPLFFLNAGTPTWEISATAISPTNDNGKDLGSSGARMRTLYAGTSLSGGSNNVFLTFPAAASLQLGAVTGAGAAVAQTLSVQGSSGDSAAPALTTLAGSDQTGATTTGGGYRIRGGNGTSAGGTVEIWTSATTTPAVAASFGADKSLTLSGSLAIGAGTSIVKHLSAAATLDFASLVAAGCEDLTISVTGAAVGDTVSIGVPNASVVANGAFSAWVSATDTVSIRFCTVISGDPASGSFRADVWVH